MGRSLDAGPGVWGKRGGARAYLSNVNLFICLDVVGSGEALPDHFALGDEDEFVTRWAGPKRVAILPQCLSGIVNPKQGRP